MSQVLFVEVGMGADQHGQDATKAGPHLRTSSNLNTPNFNKIYLRTIYAV